MKNIVLIGYRCTGKTEVGRHVARALSLQFIDTDEWVEKDMDMSVLQIVSKYGWSKFRDVERKIVARVSKQPDAVISCGGGAVRDDSNVENLKRHGVVVWLGARPEVIFERMKGDSKTESQRPSLTEKDGLSEVKDVLSARVSKYVAASDYKVDTSDIALDEVVSQVLRIFKRNKRLLI
ncbi:MAG: shikimate kinase [Candidatus Nanohalarchaeota archaeon]|nr:MAG: shikimate kinase [Candidatus Nanohaloarchaeota archaeon]